MIRPEPPTAVATIESTRFWTNRDAGPGRFFSVGNIVRFEAQDAPANFPFPHATEDRIAVNPDNSAVVGHMTLLQVTQAVEPGLSTSIPVAFGNQLHVASSGKAYVTLGSQTNSLGAIEIDSQTIAFYENAPKPGKRQLRAMIYQNGSGYDLSAPADAALDRFFAGGIAALQADAKASKKIHVRLGLSRPFPAMPTSCYAQINGLYFL
ncbi:hypothetical protein J2X24_002855 [Asticcacaulis solisilvae]|nr:MULTISPECIES: hypothetical protein [Asticcacaulis]MBP2160280.1 hypothetical protein [Asticcacaulis solisilvae]MDR6801417.1 hypothetical protein [Asticcacaulis sp. BE141]